MLEAVPLAFSHDAITLRGGIAPITHRVNTTVAVQVGPTRFANTLRTLVRRSAKGCLIGVEVLESGWLASGTSRWQPKCRAPTTKKPLILSSWRRGPAGTSPVADK